GADSPLERCLERRRTARLVRRRERVVAERRARLLPGRREPRLLRLEEPDAARGDDGVRETGEPRRTRGIAVGEGNPRELHERVGDHFLVTEPDRDRHGLREPLTRRCCVALLEREPTEVEQRDRSVLLVAELLLHGKRLRGHGARGRIVPALAGDVAEVAEDDREPPALAELAEAVGAVLEQTTGLFEVADGRGDGAEIAERAGYEVAVAELRRDLEHLTVALARVVDAARVECERARHADGLRPKRGRPRVGRLDRLVEQVCALGEVSAHLPERAQRAREAEQDLALARSERPPERCPDVVVLEREGLE